MLSLLRPYISMCAVETDNMPCSRTGYERPKRANFLYGFGLPSYAVVHEQTRLRSRRLALHTGGHVEVSLTICESYLIARSLKYMGKEIAQSAIDGPRTRIAGTTVILSNI